MENLASARQQYLRSPVRANTYGITEYIRRGVCDRLRYLLLVFHLGHVDSHVD